MKKYNLNPSDIAEIEKFIIIKNRGYFCNSRHLQDVYNRVFSKKETPTNCASCLRRKIQELENALNDFKAKQAEALEKAKQAEKKANNKKKKNE